MSHFNLKERVQPVYEANQVLSSNHLNLEQDFLIQSDLMTNAHAIGTGILTGANAKIKASGGKLENITLSCGAGITTYGFLAVFEEAKLEYARAYKDPYIRQAEDDSDKDIKGYDPFWKGSGNNRKQHKILELLTEDDVKTLSDADANALKITAQNITISDYVLLIYVESKHEDIKSCILGDCNDRGQKILTNIRKLLIKKADLDLSGLKNPYKQDGLEPLRMKRALEFGESVDLQKTYEGIFKDIVPRFEKAMEEAQARFKPYIKDTEHLKDIQKTLKNKLDEVSGVHIQLFYDFMRDLVSAYNEWIGIGGCITVGGCVDEDAFPRHLLITELEQKAVYPECRHYFHGPAGAHGQDKMLKAFAAQYLKIKAMIKYFTTEGLTEEGVRILPQYEITSSNNVIPYYYNLKEGSELRNLWDVQSILHGVAGKTTSHYSDINMEDDSNRLRFNIDDQNMFRIEGHLGRPVREVSTQIESYIDENRLAFDLVKLTRTKEGSPSEKRLQNYAAMEYQYDDYRSDIVLKLRQISAFLHKTTTDSQRWLFYTGQSMPDATILIELIGKAITLATGNLSAFDADAFREIYQRLLEEAAAYQGALGYLVQKVTSVSLESPYSKTIAGKSSAPYYMLLSMAIEEVQSQVSSLFSCLNINPIIALAYRFQAEMRWIEQNNPGVFGDFINAHEAVEHISGVTKGGTFILLVDDGFVIGDFYLPYLCCCDCVGLNEYIQAPEIYPFYIECEYDREVPITDLNIFAEEFIESGELYLGDGAQLLPEKPVTFDKDNNALMLRKGEQGFDLLLLTGTQRTKKPIHFVLRVGEKKDEEYHFWVSLRPPIIIANDDTAVTIINKEVDINLLANDLYLSNDIKLSITNEPQKGSLTRGKKAPGLVTYKPHAEKQGADYFDYSITMYTAYGIEVTSHARVTVHIVECCDDDFTPPPEEPEASLPVDIFCLDDQKRYYFTIRGKGVTIPKQPGVEFLSKKGTQYSGQKRTGAVLRGFDASTAVAFASIERGAASAFTHFTGGAGRTVPITLAPGAFAALDVGAASSAFDRIATLAPRIASETSALHPAFVPSSDDLKPGQRNIKYQIKNANGAVEDKVIKVNLVQMANTFNYEIDWENATQDKVEVKFSYPVKPANAKVSFQWHFGDGKTSQEASPTHVYKAEGGKKVLVYLSVTLDGNDACRHDIKRELTIYKVQSKDIIETVKETAELYDKIRENDKIKDIITEKEIDKLEEVKYFLPTMGVMLEGETGEENLKEGKVDEIFYMNMHKSMNNTKKVIESSADKHGSDAVEPITKLMEEQVDIIAKFVSGKNEPLNNETRKVLTSTKRSLGDLKKKNIDVNKNDKLALKLEETMNVTEHEDVKEKLNEIVHLIRQP